MKLGLISDTHIEKDCDVLPEKIGKVFAGVDLILHGGDIYVLSVLDELETIAPVLAARGNGDIRLTQDPRVKDSLVLDVEGFRIGLTHGIDYPEPSWRTLEQAMLYEFEGKVDIVVIGDTHIAMLDICRGTMLVNPGSPTLPGQIRRIGTVGLLEISPSSKAEAQIIELDTGHVSHKLTHYIHKPDPSPPTIA
ncbi:MAG: metallophosphoesterase family protein [Chloroflexota bacterium]|nr:metallophosphoesterase family protein [Chloroflexota bacterium]